MKLFRDLSEQEEKEFRAWARSFYKPFTQIDGLWHAVVQDECVKINAEASANLELPAWKQKSQ